MKFRFLSVAGVLIAAIGGILIGYTSGVTASYNETMDRLGLIHGGIPSNLDIGTLTEVQAVMERVLPPPIAYVIAMCGLFVILVGAVLAFTANEANYRRASNLFLLAALGFAAAATLTVGPTVMAMLFKTRGHTITVFPHVYGRLDYMAWSAFIFGVAFFCLVVVGGFLFLREREKRRVDRFWAQKQLS